MASLLGPQWLCECNTRGGAEDVHSAGVRAARHFLDHGVTGNTAVDNTDGNHYAVSVYRERNEWLYSISTQDEAMRIAYPLKEVASTLTTLTANVGNATQASNYFVQQWQPGQPIELGSLTMEQANAQFRATFDSLVDRRRMTLSEASRGY